MKKPRPVGRPRSQPMLLPGPTGGPRRHFEVRVELTLLASGDSLGGAATRSGARPGRALASGRRAARGCLAGGRLARDGLANRGLAGDGLATRGRLARGRLARNGLARNGLANRLANRLAGLRSSRRLATSRRLARCWLRGRRSGGGRHGHDLGASRGLATRCRLASGGLLRTRRRLASCRRTSAFARARRGLPGLCCRHEQPPGSMSRYEYGGAYIHRLNQTTYGT